MSPTAAEDPTRLAVAFTHVLRRWGLVVPVGRIPLYAEALGVVGVDSRDGVYWAGRATLVSRPGDIAAYAGACDQFWLGGPPPVRHLVAAPPAAVELPSPDAEPEPGAGEHPLPDRTEVVRYSAVETLRDKDFAVYSPEDFEAMRHL